VRVLVADDDVLLRQLTANWLTRWGYEPVFATDGDEAVGVLEGPDPPLIAILDWMMPGQDGIDVCRQVRQDRPSPYVYMIMATSKARKQNLLACLEAGADDFLSKPIDMEELHARLYVADRLLALQRTLISACDQAHYEATHDTVTGLWNRSAILKFLEHHVGRSAKAESTLSLVLLEVVGLREVNLEHGRAIGDYVLREVASRLRSAAKAFDCIGHYVGAQFLLIMPACPVSQATSLIDEMQAKINSPGIKLGNDYIAFGLLASMLTVAQGTRENANSLLHRLERSLVSNPYRPGSTSSPTEAVVAERHVPGLSKSVLISSYEPMERRMLAQKVRERGYVVHEAANAEEALRALRGEIPVRLVIFEMHTPDIADLDWIETFRRDQSVADLEVVIVAAWPSQAVVQRALSLNVSSFLTKPVDDEKLGQIISHLTGT